MISILLTNQCNLACKYCYLGCIDRAELQSEKKAINMNFAKRGIREYFSTQPKPAVRFFADGEPTLEFEKMKELYAYAESLTNNIAYFELQTNGYFGKESAEWIRDHIDIVFVSCDGIPSDHDGQRCTIAGGKTSAAIERNIRIMVENPQCQVGIRATITNRNVHHQKEMIDYFYSLGVKVLFSDKVFAPIGGSSEQFNIDNITFADTFLEARQYAIDKYGNDFFYGSMYTANFDEEVIYACRSCLPTPHLTPDGYVTCCDLCVTGGDANMRDLIYGVYDENLDVILYDQKAIKRIQSRKVENIPECQACEVRNYCAGACLGEALNETGNFYGVKQEACECIKYLWSRLGKTSIENRYLHP